MVDNIAYYLLVRKPDERLLLEHHTLLVILRRCEMDRLRKTL